MREYDIIDVSRNTVDHDGSTLIYLLWATSGAVLRDNIAVCRRWPFMLPDTTRAQWFWSRVSKGNELGSCWYWTRKSGVVSDWYGNISSPIAGEKLTHRVSWVLTHGPIPVGMQVLHSCDNPPCVRPEHLRLGDQQENIQEARAKGRLAAQQRTHCPQGHEYTPDNIVQYRGWRHCKACQRMRGTEYHRRTRAKNPEHYKQYKKEYQKRVKAEGRPPRQRQYAQCPVCGRRIDLRVDGHVGKHIRLPLREKLGVCEGSGQDAMTTLAEALEARNGD